MKQKQIIILFYLVISFLSGATQNWDIDITKSINPQHPNSDYWRITSGSAYFVSAAAPASLLVAGFVKNDKALKRKSYELLESVAIEVAISEAVKKIINRDRPAEKYPSEIFPYRILRGSSLPSGHSSLAFATATSLSLEFKKWYVTVPAFLWAASIGYSRMYLGVHYPSDVLAGSLVGIGSAWLSHFLNRKLFLHQKHLE